MLTRRYEIFIRGLVSASLLREISDSNPDLEAQTVLRGQVRDQAALQGVLRHLHSLGLELVELRQAPADPAGHRPPAPRGTELG
jgi:hypothetical protein